MSKPLSALLLIFAAGIASARNDPQSWIEVQSPNFTVITNSSEKQGRAIATQFERMRGILEVTYPELDSDAEGSVIVLALKKKEEFRRLEPEMYRSRRSLRLHGLYVRSSAKNYILMRLDAEGGNPYPIVYHEYTHLLLSQESGWMPLWLNEGLAEFYENSEIYDNKVVLGEPSEKHLALLHEEKLLPLTTLFTVDETSPYYLQEKKASMFYAESWALTHYLSLKDYVEKTAKIQNYTTLLSEKVDAVTAATRAFGDLKKLQGALQSYIDEPSLGRFESKSLPGVDVSEIYVKPISELEAQAVKADFLACNGRLEDARLLLRGVLRQDPENKMARGTELFLQAEEDRQLESRLQKVADDRPSSAKDLDALARFLWGRRQKLDEAQALESRAVSLDGSNMAYRVNLVKILLEMGRAPSAVELLRTAVANTPQEREEIDSLLQQSMTYASVTEPQQARSEEKQPDRASLIADHPKNSDNHKFVPKGSHQFMVGMLRGVRCETASLDLTINSKAKTLALHAENYYKIQFTALFTPNGTLKPCEDLENRLARVEYVESVDGSEIPRLIAVELHK